MDRRTFLSLSGVALTGTAIAGCDPTAESATAQLAEVAGATPDRLKKAVNLSMVRGDLSLVDKFRLLKDLGYDGVEINAPNEMATADVLQARDTADLPIHGVVNSVHWRQTLSDPDPAVRAEGLEGLRQALHDAHDYGAMTVLLVPAVVNEQVSYDDAYERSQVEIRKAIPLAEELGVAIAIENVWNHFLLSPLEFARYVDEFETPLVGAYFDIGNILNYGWPEHWIPILGARIMRLHAKGYSRKLRDEEGPRAGFRAEIGEDDVNWAAVRQEIARLGYTGWVTAEVSGGERERLQNIAHQLDEHVLGSTGQRT
jgi:L-ribulose-5-phosphate 3-epimerase